MLFVFFVPKTLVLLQIQKAVGEVNFYNRFFQIEDGTGIMIGLVHMIKIRLDFIESDIIHSGSPNISHH